MGEIRFLNGSSGCTTPLISEYHERVKPDAPWGNGCVPHVVRRRCRVEAHACTQFNESLEGHDSEESRGILARHQLVVMDDRQQLQGATTDQVREHFDKWTVDELRRNWREQPVPKEKFAKFVADNEMDHAGLRYNFCLLADDLCLESLDKMPGRPVVKLVSKHWAPYAEDELDQLQCDLDDGPEEDIPSWEGGVSNVKMIVCCLFVRDPLDTTLHVWLLSKFNSGPVETSRR